MADAKQSVKLPSWTPGATVEIFSPQTIMSPSLRLEVFPDEISRKIGDKSPGDPFEFDSGNVAIARAVYSGSSKIWLIAVLPNAANGGSASLASQNGAVGFFGTNPQEQATVAAEATDAGSTQTLANSLRDILIANGLVAE